MSGIFLLFTLIMIIGLCRHTDRWLLDKGVLLDSGNLLYLLRPLPILVSVALITVLHGVFGFAGRYRLRAETKRTGIWRDTLRVLGIVFLCLIVLTILELGFKLVLPQPAGSLPTDVYGLRLTASYPSGHAARLCFLVVLAAGLLPRKLSPLIIGIGAAFMIMLFLSAIHYPSDLIGGALLGTIIGMFAISIIDRTGQKKLDISAEE